jgi:pimeloyl-ACP methyl ester carboxylesterase
MRGLRFALYRRGILFLLAVCLGFGQYGFAVPQIEPAVFTKWFNRSFGGVLNVPESVRNKALTYGYVFVGGWGNELAPGYFSGNISELKALGVPEDHIHRIFPPSTQGLSQNAEFVRTQITNWKGPEKLVLIGHSRGGLDALLFALKNPDFTEKRVEAVFLIQAPFKGSGLADYLVGEGIALDERMPSFARKAFYWLGEAERRILRRWTGHGLADLTHQQAKESWEKRLQSHVATSPGLRGKVFYIRSAVEPQKQTPYFWASSWYLSTYYGKNDGLVTLEDQFLSQLGQRLNIVGCGHHDLTGSFPLTFATSNFRKALSRSVFMAVGQPEQNSIKEVAAVKSPLWPVSTGKQIPVRRFGWREGSFHRLASGSETTERR